MQCDGHRTRCKEHNMSTVSQKLPVLPFFLLSLWHRTSAICSSQLCKDYTNMFCYYVLFHLSKKTIKCENVKSPHLAFSYRHLIRALTRTKLRHYQKCTSPWIVSGITHMFDIRFPSCHLVQCSLQHSSCPPPIPDDFPYLTSPSTFSSIHSSDWQLYDTTLNHQASPSLYSAEQTGMWMLLYALTNLLLLSGFWTIWFPSTFFLSIFILSAIFES